MNFAAVGGRGLSIPTEHVPAIFDPELRVVDSRKLARALLRMCTGKVLPMPESPAEPGPAAPGAPFPVRPR